MALQDIPVRSNGETIDSSWFNTIRTKLLEEFGSGVSGEFTLADGVGAATDITGMIFSGASVRTAFIEYDIYRNTTGGGAVEFMESGMIIANYKAVAGTWTFTQGPVLGSTGVTFSLLNTGQFQYTSTSTTGTFDVFEIKWRSRTIAV